MTAVDLPLPLPGPPEPAAAVKSGRQIRWYRTPIDKTVLKTLSTRSDFKGALQTLSYLAIYATTAAAALYSVGHLRWYVTVACLFLHGMVAAFMINGVHELGHGTVFKTKALNKFFEQVLAFLGWINHRMFSVSHARHHAYTLHPPDDLEVTLPVRLAVRHFFIQGFVNPLGLYYSVKDTIRIARGQMRGAWELTLFPPGDLQKRKGPVDWARTLLWGHAVIVLLFLCSGIALHSPALMMVPVVTTFAPFYGGWLFFLCNNTQHIGLQDNVPDFRLCCRTFILNPVVRVLYWQMNFHTEHHMYPTVPCYYLNRLHQAVAQDLPPCPRGLYQTWKEITAILGKQADDPKYQHIAIVPIRPHPQG
jgi:fatty acid desaturase